MVVLITYISFSHHYNTRRKFCLKYVIHASAYEVCDHTHMPLHTPLCTPKTLAICKKKSSPCLIQKASRCADLTSKTTFFYLSLSIKHKDLTKKSCLFIFYFIGSVVKIACFYFVCIKDNRLQKN